MKRRSTVLSGLSLVLAAVGLVSMVTSANAQDPLFAPPVNYGAGGGSWSVFSADLDGDNDNDLAVANGSDNVSILLNNGDGTFQTAVNYGAGDGPNSVYAADLDGDGDDDLALANQSSDNVSILINLSNGEPPPFCEGFTGLFCDDFEDGTLNKWNPIFGNWEVITADGNSVSHLQINSLPNRRMVSTNTFPNNIIISSKVKGNNFGGTFDLSADMTIGFLANESGSDFYYVLFGGGVDSDGNKLCICKMDNQVPHLLVINENIVLENNAWYNSEIQVENSDIYAKVWDIGTAEPNEWQISYSGSSGYGSHVLLGAITGEQDEEVWFDDFTVSSLPACNNFNGLFCDDFEDGIITDWQVLTGSCIWSEASGILSTSNTGQEQWCIQTVGDQSWDNYVLEAKVRGNSGVDKVLVFRVQDANNYYAVNLRSGWGGVDEITFDKMVNGVYNADIVTADYPSENGVWYHLKVACTDNSFKVYVDDILLLEYTDNDNPYYTGGIGVACWTGLEGNCDISFDNVAVTCETPPELAQYDFIKDRLENLEIDLFPITIPTADYDLGATNSFVDIIIRPGYPSEQQLEAFLRLLMSMKLVNAGYRYVPDGGDPLPETETVRGAEEMWDLGVKNTASAIVAVVGFIHIFDDIGADVFGEKLYGKILAKLVGFIVDAVEQVKRFIPSQEVRNWLDLLFPALKQAILNQLREDPCLMCIIVEPGVRLVGDEIAISGYHVPHTQGCVDDAGLWASTYDYTGSFAAAVAAFQDQWTIIKDMTDESAQTIAQYEASSGAPDAIDKTQELLDSPFSGSIFVTIKKFLEVIDAILNPRGIYYSVKAAGEAFSTAPTVATSVDLGIHNVFGHDSEKNVLAAEPTVRASNLGKAAGLSSESLPTELETFNGRAADLVNAIGGGDSVAIFDAAESLHVAIDDLGDFFDTYFDELTSKTDSAWEQVTNFDSLLAVADSASITANMRLMQGYFITLGIQLNPYDSEFNSMSIIALDSATVDLEQSWWTVDSVQQLLSGVPAVPTLILIPEQDYFIVSRDSQFVVNYVVTNIGDGAAVEVYSRAFQVEGITIHSADSISLTDVSPGDSIPLLYSISLDSVADPTTYYQTSLFDVAAYASNGTGSQVTVLVTAPTYWCGDVDGSSSVNVADLTYLVDYLFFVGPAPPVMEAANVDGEGGVNVADLTYLVDYLFFEGPEPICGLIE